MLKVVPLALFAGAVAFLSTSSLRDTRSDAAFKVPVRVWISDDELPRNASGKVLKRELRERFLA